MAQAPANSRICVGKIGAAHGIQGEVKLFSFTADPLAVGTYGPLESADGTRAVEIEALRPAKDCLVARLKGVADRAAAERLRNLELFVPRGRLPQPADNDEFYHADLIGLTVLDTQGAALGEIVAVQNFGAGDLIEVQLPDGGERVMLPFTVAAVPVVDIAGGRVVIDPPQGLFKT